MSYVISWLVSGVIGTIVGFWRRKPAAGATWGLLLGPIGWLLVAVFGEQRPRCSECLSLASVGARKCRHCGSPIEQFTAPPPSRSGAFVLNRTWCDCIAVLIVGALLGSWAISRSRSADKDSIDNEPPLSGRPGETANATFDLVAAKLRRSDPPERISRLKYDRVVHGMSYPAVTALFQSSGREISHTGIAGSLGVNEPADISTYQWTNEDGSTVTAVFKNWILIQKSHIGLDY
jgi:hypothetical protein